MTRIGTRIIRSVNQFRSIDWLWFPSVTFALTRLIIFVSGYLSLLAFPTNRGNGLWRRFPDNLLLDGWIRWDSGYYMEIFERGYNYVPGTQCTAAFFPLYPLLAKSFSIFTDEAAIALLLTSLTAFWGALIYLYKLTLLEFQSREIAERTVFYFSIFPTAFFYNSVYSESLFALWTIGAFYFARKQRWWPAGLFAMLASATRAPGILLWGVLWLEWLRSHGFTIEEALRSESWKSLFAGIKKDWRSLIPIQLVPLGLVAFMLFLNCRFDEPLAFAKVQSAWSRDLHGPLTVLLDSVERLFAFSFLADRRFDWVLGLDLLFFLFAISMGLVAWKKLGTSYGFFTICSMLIPITTSTQSLSRMASVCFPAFFYPAILGKNENWNRAILFGSGILLALLSARFVNWMWIA